MGRPHVALLPGRPQTFQKRLQLRISARGQCRDLAGGELREVALHRPNLIEQPQRIQGGRHGAQLVFHPFWDGLRRQEPGARGSRQVIAFRHPGTDPGLRSQFERRLEEVHEKPGRLIEPSQDPNRREPFKPSVSDQPSDDRAVLLFDPGLVVLAVGPRPRELDRMVMTVGDDDLVQEFAAVV